MPANLTMKDSKGVTHILGGISLGRGSQGTSSLPLGSEEFLGIPKVPTSS